MTIPADLQDLHVLLSARDAGAAGHIGAIAHALLARGGTCTIIAQPPALALLHADGLPVTSVDDWLGYTFPDGPIAALPLAGVSAALTKIGPDCLVLGQSHRAEFSIDDWLLAASGVIPSAIMQDFWGEVKPVSGRAADLFLTLDAFAEEVTRQKTAAETAIVGSPKHARYQTLDAAGLRDGGRASLGLGADEYVVGYFGQDLNWMPGYRETVMDIGRSAAALDGAKLIYRPHPRERRQSIEQTMSLLAGAGASPILYETSKIEAALALVDAVVSCFSTCGYDALYLARSSELSPVVVFADYNPEIKRYWTEHAQINAFPAVDAGAAFEASSSAALRDLLAACGDKEFRSLVRTRVQHALPDPAAAPDACVDALLNLIAERSQVRALRRAVP